MRVAAEIAKFFQYPKDGHRRGRPQHFLQFGQSGHSCRFKKAYDCFGTELPCSHNGIVLLIINVNRTTIPPTETTVKPCNGNILDRNTYFTVIIKRHNNRLQGNIYLIYAILFMSGR